MDHLNSEQRLVVDTEENILLVACPGSGKTHTLIHKVAKELSKIDTHRQFVIAITYTNAAADEIKERVQNLGCDISQLWVGTIHSFCLEWIVYPYSMYIDSLPANFTIMNDNSQLAIVSEIFPEKSKWECLDLIAKMESYRKNVYLKEIPGFNKTSELPDSDVCFCIDGYVLKMRDLKMIDFQMILEHAYHALSNYNFIGENLRNIFSFIAVDEYQDTQPIQYLILAKILGGMNKTKMLAVGDPNQSIFESLGGMALGHQTLQTIMGVKFKKLSFSRNYRSSRRIVQYSKNYMVVPQSMDATGDVSEYQSRIFVLDQYNSDVCEKYLEVFLSNLIDYNVNTLGIDPSEICILAPQWHHIFLIAHKLKEKLNGISVDSQILSPFRGNEFGIWSVLSKIALTEPSIKMYSKRMAWSNDVVRLLKEDINILNFDLDVSDVLNLGNRFNKILCNDYDDTGSAGEYLERFFDMFLDAISSRWNISPHIRNSREMFLERFNEYVEKIWKDYQVNIGSLEYCRNAFGDKDGVKVSTIHKVKGQEFDTVILIAALDQYIPHRSIQGDRKRECEAKKILYVTATRARKNLWIVAERDRVSNNNISRYVEKM